MHGLCAALTKGNTISLVSLSVIDEEGVFSLKGFELEPFPELNLD